MTILIQPVIISQSQMTRNLSNSTPSQVQHRDASGFCYRLGWKF